jgi:SAM-dependent methyltransferase
MAELDYGRFSLWRDPATFDDAKARQMADNLELRGRVDDEVATRAAYLDLLAIAPGERVLDVGCGSGVVTREMARRVAPGGLAVGLDASAALVNVARELAAQQGMGRSVTWRVGDARALPFADETFDAVLAVTVLSHVPGAERGVSEMVRVTRPGGRAGVCDLDGDSFVIAHPDRRLTRRITAAFSDHGTVNGMLGRRLPGLLADMGLREVRVHAFMPLELDPGGFYARVAERAAEVAEKTGTISNDERQAWLNALRAEQAAGRFLAGRLHIFAWGVRPR